MRLLPLLSLSASLSPACQVPDDFKPDPSVGAPDTDAETPPDEPPPIAPTPDTGTPSNSAPEVPVDTADTGRPAPPGPPPPIVTPQDVTSPVDLPGCAAAPDPALLAPCEPGVAAWNGQVRWPSLQAALDNAEISDTVVVCPGVHPGPLVVANAVHLVAADPTGGTILDGNGTSRILEQRRGLLTLNGFVLRHGRTFETGGAIHSPSGTLEVVCSLFEGNHADDSGGAIDAQGPLTIQSSIFRNNHSGYEAGAVRATSTLDLRDSLLAFNESRRSGAVEVGPTTHITRVTMRDNRAETTAGAVGLGGWDDSQLDVEDSFFFSNFAGLEGAAMDLGGWAFDTITVRRSVFQSNESFDGGIVSITARREFDFSMVDCEVSHNETTNGAPLVVQGDQERDSSILLERTVFARNVSASAVSAFGTMGTNWLWWQTPPTHIVAVDMVFHQNLGAASAVSIRATDDMRCERCDFGSGRDDNWPSDIEKDGVVRVQAPANFQL